MAITARDIGTLAELDEIIACDSLEGHWNMALPESMEPRSKLLPMHWSWATLREYLMQAGKLISVSDAGRRTIRLLNPGIAPRRSTTHTMQMSVQLVLPGEIATAHRHTMAALRFVVEGHGAFTNVQGRRFLMEPGDLILTPEWTWHDHVNETGEPIVWLDGLDFPFVAALDAAFIEKFDRPQQPVQEVVRTADKSRWYYKWSDAEQQLQRMASQRTSSAEDDLVLEYKSSAGGPTLPSLMCGLLMLQPGERLRTRRRTSSGIFHVVRGSGSSVVGSERFEWARGDCLVVPNWTWHHHENRSDEASILFFMSDRPMLEAFGLYHEQAGDR